MDCEVSPKDIILVDVNDLGVEKKYEKLKNCHTARFKISIYDKGRSMLYGIFRVGNSYFKGQIEDSRIIEKVNNFNWRDL